MALSRNSPRTTPRARQVFTGWKFGVSTRILRTAPHDRMLASSAQTKDSMVIWITGLSGAGKSTISRALVDRMHANGRLPVLLDGDLVRGVVAAGDTGHDRESRIQNAYRICRLARMLESQGHLVICATMSLFHEIHKWNRANLEEYYEVYLTVDFETLKQRDPKRLYHRAALGEEDHVVGLDLAAEEPREAHLVIHNDGPDATVDVAVGKILRAVDPFGK